MRSIQALIGLVLGLATLTFTAPVNNVANGPEQPQKTPGELLIPPSTGTPMFDSEVAFMNFTCILIIGDRGTPGLTYGGGAEDQCCVTNSPPRVAVHWSL
uniref:Uncharacterized protein n=1 Tax=Knipowitschia caucasica TaxID=637954 RepID=A0AAV2LUP3_KNICA